MGAGTVDVQFQGVTTLECSWCRWILLRSIHDGCGPRWCSTCNFPLHQSRRPTWLNFRGILEHIQLTSPAAKAKGQHADTAAALQQAHLDSVATVNHKAMVEEEQKCQAFAEEFSTAFKSCPLEDHWALMYLPQLLASGISLVPLLGMPATTWPQATADIGSISATLTLDTPVPQPSNKWWHPSSDQGMPDPGQEEEAPCDLSEEPTHKKQKPLARTFREAQWEAFSKDSEVVNVTQQTYHKTHKVMFDQEGSCVLTSVFREMAWETSLLNVKIYEVQEAWTSWWGLKAVNHTAKASQRDIQFFCVVTPTESPNIMGLKGIYSLEALCQWGGQSFCPWCRKEGQNESTVINHLRTVHYHLGLVCALCMDFFATSVDTMRWHMHVCKSMATEDKDCEEEEESENDDDSNKDNGATYLRRSNPEFCNSCINFQSVCSSLVHWH